MNYFLNERRTPLPTMKLGLRITKERSKDIFLMCSLLPSRVGFAAPKMCQRLKLSKESMVFIPGLTAKMAEGILDGFPNLLEGSR